MGLTFRVLGRNQAPLFLLILYLSLEFNKNLQRKLGIARKQVASYLWLRKLLATHSTGRIGSFLCLFMRTQFQLGSLHPCTNETHSKERFNPYFGWFVLLIIIPAKVGIKSVENVFLLCMHGYN